MEKLLIQKKVQKLADGWGNHTDQQRWAALIAIGKDLPGTVMLDNDDTYLVLETMKDKDGDYDPIFQFRDYIGWADGVLHLLKAAGIPAECV